MIWTPAGRSSRPFNFVQAPPESSSLPHLESNAPLDTKECSSSNAVTIVEEGDKSTQCKFIFSVGPLPTVDLEISPRRTKKDRRTPKKWSAEQEDALRAGVGVYKTKWASILDDQRFASVLYRRSNVDLKDKWRNLSKKPKQVAHLESRSNNDLAIQLDMTVMKAQAWLMQCQEIKQEHPPKWFKPYCSCCLLCTCSLLSGQKYTGD